MTLLEQCQIWNDNDEYQKIIDAIEAVPAEERTPELDSELARAYNNAAGIGDRDLYEKAIALLKPHEAYFAGDHKWNFRMGYAYYYLDQEGPALRYFEQALEARPGDRDTQGLIDDCRSRLALPRFRKNFRERVVEAWAAFEREEGELRRLMDEPDRQAVSEELLGRCGKALHAALADVAFELGFNGEKYELILSPEGSRASLFQLVYFQRHAPVGLLERWNIWVGRQASRDFALRMGEDEISGRDVQVWVEKGEERQAGLTLYCEKLRPMLSEDEGRAWWMLSNLTDQVLGEVAAMSLIQSFEVLSEPKAGEPVLLEDLPEALEAMGLIPYSDPANYLESSYQAYQMEPEKDRDADWRMDVYAGSTRLPVLIHEYLSNESDVLDQYHRDGVAAGFLCYPMEGFSDAESVLSFRDELESAVREKAGEDAVAFLGGASGLYCGYLDFVAWDLPAVLDAALEFLEGTDLEWASFHSFRRTVGTVRLMDRRDGEPEVDPETGSLLSQADVEQMNSFGDGRSGYFYKMLDYLQQFIQDGVEAGRFTERQARADLQIALWYAYACNNIGEYAYYARAARWMSASERHAKGCGTWYYRYSVALMYCGRLEEAVRYAEQGALEEPDYPWIWLQVAKLRSHGGDRVGALEAARRGLALVPGDHEFLTLLDEIDSGATLEQMEYHWIDPEYDGMLQDGLDENADEKQRAISCITVDPAGLERFRDIFRPDPESFLRDAPYCSFRYVAQGRPVELVFQMNEAGLSKLRPDWLSKLKADLDTGRWAVQSVPEGEGRLVTVLAGLDYGVTLLYRIGKDEQRSFRMRLDENGEPDGYEMVEPDEVLAAEVYTEEEMEAVERHIKAHFGDFENVFHELVSPDIHVDICVIPPAGERDYYRLVTMGMGAHRMNVPEELAEYRLERAELSIALPGDWKLDRDAMEDERWYWPVRLLKVLARLPGGSDTWLGWGHTMDHGEPFAEDTALSAALLVGVQGGEEGGEVCVLPNGEEVNFYQVIPLYKEELEFKLTHDADDLLDKMSGTSFVVSPDRPCGLTAPGMDERVMDEAAWHLSSIREKKLAVDELAAYDHMAIYLRWCLEHDLMGLEFLERHWDAVRQFQNDPVHTDLRPLIRDELQGGLLHAYFDEQGQAFSRYYYGSGDVPYFPADIDDYALRYFGPERYHSDEFRDEAYLFIPFDEAYYQDMAAVMDHRWSCWQRQEVPEESREPSELAVQLMDRLDCACTYFPPMRDDDPITAALGYARRLAVREGFVPVLLRADDEALLAELERFSGADLTELLSAGAVGDGPHARWDPETGLTVPLILANVPVRETRQAP